MTFKRPRKPRKPELTPKSLTEFLASTSTTGDELIEVLAVTVMIILAFRASDGKGFVREMHKFHRRVLRAACDNFLRKGKRRGDTVARKVGKRP